MQLIFARSHSPGSLLIRAMTFSKWSHVAMIRGGTVIEARWPRVRITTLDAFKSDHSAWEYGALPVGNVDDAWDYAYDQIGKPYDVGGLLALPFQQRAWQSDERWFCSELVAAAANYAGARLFRDSERSRVTPGDLWRLTV